MMAARRARTSLEPNGSSESLPDPVEQVVELLRPRMVGWKHITGRGRWALGFPPDEGIAFGIQLEGTCRADISGGPPLELAAGDYLLISRPPRWQLSHPEGAQAVQYEGRSSLAEFLCAGGAGEPVTARMLGGYLAVDPAVAGLVGDLLEPVTVLRAPAARRLRTLLGLVDEESGHAGRASRPILDRLLEVMLMEALRLQAVLRQEAGPGLLRGLGDRGVGQALRAMHGRPGEPWTLGRLAAVSHTSRSVFAERFEQLVGAPPMRYLYGWRMLCARRALLGGVSVEEAAAASGYGSARAFSAAFKRAMGAAPSSVWRRKRSSDDRCTLPDAR